jgi:hypothetical protein
VVFLSDPTAILREIGTKNCFDVDSKVTFITDPLQPNLLGLHHVGRKYHVVLLIDPTAILRETGTKNCFDLKSKVPFITDRLQHNLFCLYHIGSEYHVVFFSDSTAILREIGTKNSRSRVKCPSLPNYFNLPCSACTTRAASTIWYYSVTPLHS